MQNSDDTNLENFGISQSYPIPSPEEFIAFKKKVASLINLDLTNYKNKQMERRIAATMSKNNVKSLMEYHDLLVQSPKHLTEFVNMLTINVTEFFRNPERFAELEKKYLPGLLEKNQKIKIWSAGCSIGTEVYTLVMILDKLGVLDRCELIASDFDEKVIAKAKEAIYSKLEFATVPAEHKKHFQPVDEERVKFNPALASKVIFKKQDLLNSKFDSGFDLILCRNVVIYFTEEAKDVLYKKFYDSLKPEGVMFIGATERINRYKEIGFNLSSMFFYQK